MAAFTAEMRVDGQMGVAAWKAAASGETTSSVSPLPPQRNPCSGGLQGRHIHWDATEILQ